MDSGFSTSPDQVSELSQHQYKQITEFIKRINLEVGGQSKQDREYQMLQSPSTRESLIPTLPKASETVTLEMPDGEKHEIPVYQPSIGPKALDGPILSKKTGLFTYDPGFTSTASCVSAITYIDGEQGKLLYRGYSIDKIAESCTFLETCFLLLYGDLPDEQ